MPKTENVLKVLILEDVPEDAELMLRELRKAGTECSSQLVSGREKFIAAIDDFQPDVILVDYTIPKFMGDESLRLCLDKCPDIPFIYVSGTMGEEAAIDALTHGATDYVLKSQLSKLGLAVQRAVKEVKDRAAHNEAARRVLLLQQREDFVAILTHDLKTPLIAIESGLTAVLEEEYGELNRELRRLLGNLRTENVRLLNMIQTLLELYRYEGAGTKSVFQKVDLNVLLNDASSQFAAEAENRHVKIKLFCPRDKVTVYADPIGLRHVFNNLLDNAIQHSEKGSRIDISIKECGDSAELAVKNYGPPIDPEERLKLFKSLGKRKGSDSISSGLGLYLVGKIVETHGGEVNCSSTERDGTTFTVKLPNCGMRLVPAQG
jgi:two-component system, NtrC family, sensor kinase